MTARRRPARRSQASLTAIAMAVVLLLGGAYILLTPMSLTDEAWFLQVCSRLAGGERLYADVFFPATPLSAWFLSVVMRVFGVQALVLKAFLVLVFSGTVLFAAAALRALGLRRMAPVLAGAALLAVAPPGTSGAPYNAVASLLMTGSLVATLLWLESMSESPRASGAAVGVMLGLTFAAKQNVGVFALAAFVAVAAYALRTRGATRSARLSLTTAGAVFATVVAAIVIPIVAGGSFVAFLHWSGSAQANYAATAGVSLAEGMSRAAAETGSLPLLALFALPVLAIGSSAFAFAARRDPKALALLAFAVAALACAFPRWDVQHLSIGAPLLIAALAGAWPAVENRVPAKAGRAAAAAAIVIVPVAALAVFGTAVLPLAGGSYESLGVAHFAGALAPAEVAGVARRTIETLKASGDRDIFVLSPRASLFYLGSGISNPTVDDYPVSHTDEALQRSIIAAVQRGEIGAVWWDPLEDREPEYAPVLLEDYLRTSMVPALRTKDGTLYRLPPPAARKGGA